MSGEGPPFSAPAAFGRFRVLHQIGAGSLGPVFRAEDPEDHTPVVIKVFQLNLPPERAHEVAEGLSGLIQRLPDHPAIARTIAAGLHEVSPYTVTILAPGQSLDVALRDFGPAVISDALPRLETLAAGLDTAVESWSWHGNLHPRDILIDEHRTTVVGVGVAPLLERAGARLPVRRPYAAPEVIDGRRTTPASDQYALAAIAYEWLFGRRAPLADEVSLSTPPLPGVDQEALSRAFATAMAADPEARFDSCGAFVAAMAASVRDAALAASSAETPRRERRRITPLPLLDDAPAEPPPPPAARPMDLGDADAPEPPRSPDLNWSLDPDPELVAASKQVDVPADSIDIDSLTVERLVSRPSAAAPPPPPPPPPPSAPEPDPIRIEPVAWQGGLGSAPPPVRVERRGFGFTTLAAALLLGIAGGIGGAYALWRANVLPDPNAIAGREFTNTALAPQADAQPTPPPAANSAEAPSAPTSGDASRGGSTRGGSAVADPPAVPASRTEEPPADAKPAPAPSGGRLLVRSTPAGAEVRLNGISKGVTPLTLTALPLGTHTVVLTRPGYARSEQRVALTRERPARTVEAQLNPAREPSTATAASRPAGSRATTATLVVESRPSGATVILDGREAGTTPLTLEAVPAGRHTVQLTLPGYPAWTTSVTVEAGGRARVAASLGGD